VRDDRAIGTERAIVPHRNLNFSLKRRRHCATIRALCLRLREPSQAGCPHSGASGFPALTSDCGHVETILTHHFATPASRLARFRGGPDVRGAFGVCRPSTFRRDFALTLTIHRRKASLALL